MTIAEMHDSFRLEYDSISSFSNQGCHSADVEQPQFGLKEGRQSYEIANSESLLCFVSATEAGTDLPSLVPAQCGGRGEVL